MSLKQNQNCHKNIYKKTVLLFLIEHLAYVEPKSDSNIETVHENGVRLIDLI